jgi:hypothetical protein
LCPAALLTYEWQEPLLVLLWKPVSTADMKKELILAEYKSQFQKY